MSVIDAIQGDGFHPLWQEVQLTFNAGVAPRQLTSDHDVHRAASAGEITLMPTRRGVSLRGGGTEALMTEAEEAAKGWPDEKQGVVPA